MIKIVATGGTIANTRAGRIPIQQVMEDIHKNDPGAAEVLDSTRVDILDLIRVGSEVFTSKEFLDIARVVNHEIQNPEINGVIITQGTVTTEETAYFLHLLVRSHKPVVITNSQRRHGTVGNDGDKNLLDAIAVVLSPEAMGKGALVVSNQTINCGREVIKTSSRPGAFVSGEHGILGIIENDRVTFYRSPARRHTGSSEFDINTITDLPKVEVISAYYDADPGLIDAAVRLGVKGIIVNGLTAQGSPHAAQRDAFEKLAKQGMPIVLTARGGVNNRINTKPGSPFISGDNLPAQKARILLQLALTRTAAFRDIQRIFNEY